MTKPKITDYYWYLVGSTIATALLAVWVFFFFIDPLLLKFAMFVLCSLFTFFFPMMFGFIRYTAKKCSYEWFQTAKTRLIPMLYKNYKGETSEYLIYPEKVYFGKTEYHPEEQWLLAAYKFNPENLDDKIKFRVFALSDILKIHPTALIK